MVVEIQKQAAELKAKLVAIRRHLHQHPELSFKEYNTSKYIASILDENGISYTENWAGTGIVAELGSGDKTISLRADIDALPIQEVKDRPYHSKEDNVMHACGHDVHTTCLLGALLILNGTKLNGRIKAIFQPGEEKLPGGASIMIAEGVLKNPTPELIIGQHVHPPLEVGKIGVHAGPYMASADELYLKVTGEGGHAALPENYNNPLIAASEVLLSLQQLFNKYVEAQKDVIICFGKLYSDGGATNVVPECVYAEGTFRAMDEKLRNEIHHKMLELVKEVEAQYQLQITLDIKKGYPVLNNDVRLTNHVQELAEQYLGKDNVVQLPKRMTSEDFAFYSHHIPASFYRLGTGNVEKGITSPVHTPTFDVDENCLELGAGLMAYLAYTTLK